MPPSRRKAGRCRLPITLPAMKKRKRDRACGRSRRRRCRACRSRSRWRAACRCRTRRRRSAATARAARSRRRSPAPALATGTITPAAMAISSKPAEKAVGLAAHDQPPPRRGEAELGLEEHHAERKAEHDQRGGRRLAVDQHQRDQHRGGQHRRRSGTASRGAATRAAARASVAAEAHGICQLMIGPAAGGSRAEAERLLDVVPAGARRRDRTAAHRRSIRPSSRRRARTSGRPSISDSTNQLVAAQWPVLQ